MSLSENQLIVQILHVLEIANSCVSSVVCSLASYKHVMRLRPDVVTCKIFQFARDIIAYSNWELQLEKEKEIEKQKLAKTCDEEEIA